MPAAGTAAKATGRRIPVARKSGVYARHKLTKSGERCPADISTDEAKAGTKAGRCRCDATYYGQDRPGHFGPKGGKLTAEEAAEWLRTTRKGEEPAPPAGTPVLSGHTIRGICEAHLKAARIGTALTRFGKRYDAGTLTKYEGLLQRHIYDAGYGDLDAAMPPHEWQSIVDGVAQTKSAQVTRDGDRVLSPQMVVAIFSPIRAAMQWATLPTVALLSANPVAAIRWPKRGKGKRKRVVTREVAPAMIAALPRDQGVHVIWALMFYAGLRVSEACALDWTDIDFRRGLVVVPESKSEAGEQREIPLVRPLRATLREWRGSTPRIGALVPGVQGVRMNDQQVRSVATGRKRDGKVTPGAFQRAGLPALTPHEARHTFASWLVAAGVDLAEIQRVLGHSSLVVTAAYVQTLPGGDRTSRDRLDEYLDATG